MARAGTTWHRNYRSNFFNRVRRNFPLRRTLKQWHRKLWCTFWRNSRLFFRHTSLHCCTTSHGTVQCFIDFSRWKKTKARMTFSAIYDVKFKASCLLIAARWCNLSLLRRQTMNFDVEIFPKHKIKSNNFFRCLRKVNMHASCKQSVEKLCFSFQFYSELAQCLWTTRKFQSLKRSRPTFISKQSVEPLTMVDKVWSFFLFF